MALMSADPVSVCCFLFFMIYLRISKLHCRKKDRSVVPFTAGPHVADCRSCSRDNRRSYNIYSRPNDVNDAREARVTVAVDELAV